MCGSVHVLAVFTEARRGAGVIDSCESAGMDAGNQTQVLYRNIHCS